MAAREQAEQRLREARATIRALETKLAHERIAREEAIRQLEEERRTSRDELEGAWAAQRQAEQQRDEAIAARQEAVERRRALSGSVEAQESPTAPMKAKAR